MIHHGDCLEVMAGMEPDSVSAIVTDPPYDLTSTGARKGSPRNPGTGPFGRGFMGKAWDGTGVAFRPETWAGVLRLAKPGAYLVAFGGTRTYHRMAVAIEDAGWEIRDALVWAYASGYPKSLNLGRANDVNACRSSDTHDDDPAHLCPRISPPEMYGLGTALKPAWEPLVLARKPFASSVIGNWAEHGTGALNIDGTRIPFASDDDREDTAGRNNWGDRVWDGPAAILVGERPVNVTHDKGRWPPNVMLTDAIFDGGIAGVIGGGDTNTAPAHLIRDSASRVAEYRMGPSERMTQGDSGTYSRFFLIPKADRADREPVLGGLPVQTQAPTMGAWPKDVAAKSGGLNRQNVHPTVKPTELMRHLVRLVTPSGGTVLDPFLGSGTTGIACELEGFPWIGIEKEAEYVAIARARLNGTQRGLGLSA